MPPRRRAPSSRRRVSVPSIDLHTRSRSRAYEDLVLASGRRTTPAPAAPMSAETARELSPDTERAVELARQGEDSLLMPYQPTPSINPPRPRTRAIGYDPQTRTMWIRFRESAKYPNGAVYEYYNVPPNFWKNVRRVKSPGRWMNRVGLDNFEYRRTDL